MEERHRCGIRWTTDTAEDQLREIVFYKLNEVDQTVTIYAIVDGKREFHNLL